VVIELEPAVQPAPGPSRRPYPDAPDAVPGHPRPGTQPWRRSSAVVIGLLGVSVLCWTVIGLALWLLVRVVT